MKDSILKISPMSREDLDLVVEWAAAEGWNPGMHDADCYYLADPEGFLMGWLDGVPVAAISVVRYDDSFGFLGFYMVRPEARGKGYGMQIWQAGMARLAGCNVGLDGVVAQQENYRKSGFRLAWRNRRYQGVGGGQMPVAAQIVNLAEVPFPEIAAYEQPFFPAPRPQFSYAWISQPGARTLGILDNGRLAGLGVIRPCRSGHKIGPMLADDAILAETLFLALRSGVAASEPVFLDVPDANPAAVEMAERHGMEVVFETARMYTGDFPDMPLGRLYGVTSFEIG